MANITVNISSETELTVFKVEGDLSADDIIEYSSKFYIESPTKLVLWDATNGSVGNINTDDFRRISVTMKKYTAKRAGGKTAIVGKFDVDFGSARMYEAFAETEKIPILYKTFRTVDDAMVWLNS